jgi:DNA mismatch endonuclease (patch repair protein)
MTDVFTKKKRSWVMSRIRSKWTKQEKLVHNYLKGKKIKHVMHPKIEGSPDVILPDKKIAIFLHGCFWHKCPIHYREPKSKRKYWLPKIEKNVIRDKKNIRLIRKHGWRVVRIWEHQINKNPEKLIDRIIKNTKNE